MFFSCCCADGKASGSTVVASQPEDQPPIMAELKAEVKQALGKPEDLEDKMEEAKARRSTLHCRIWGLNRDSFGFPTLKQFQT